MEQGTLFTVSNNLSLDFWYFADRYAGLGPGAPYSFERLVSGSIYHVDPTSGQFVVPVTVGAFGELFFAFGPAGLLLAALVAGAALARLSFVGTSLVGRAVALFAAVGLYTWLIRGGLVYYVFNYAAVTLILLAVYTVVRLLAHANNSELPSLRSRPDDPELTADYAKRSGF